MAQSHTRRNTIPGTPGITRSGTVMHWLGMLAMVIGLFAPLATVDAATTAMTPEQALMKAAQQPFDRDTSDFQRVVLVGDFQQQFGCGNWDTNCDQTRLQNINGFWTGAFGVPPGSWSWELVAVDRNGTEFSIDSGQIGVADGQAGVYADFNSATRDSSVSVVDSIAYANGMFGDIALAQSGDGFVAPALNIGNDGWVDMQVTVNGESVQTGGSFQQGVSRVSFDAFGNVTNVEYRGFSEVTVQRTDADGNPLSGSCFGLDGASQSRGCDSDGSSDGSGDGNTTLRFPGGFQPGTYTLRETRAADGAEQLADQQVDVQPGQSTIQARSEGDPTPETGDLVVLRQDENGAPVGGACFEIINQNGEVTSSACDEDGDVADDGRIGILGIPAGDYTLSETRTPQGYESAQDTFVTIWPNEVTEQPVVSAVSAAQPSDDPDPIETEEPTEEVTEEPTEEATEEPTEEASQPPVTGRLIFYRQDDVGNPVGGSCFEVLDGSGQIVGDACDEDGIAADDGTTGIENVPVGDYTMVESRVPEGYQQAPDTQVTVTEGDVIYTVVAPAIPATEEPTEEVTEEPTEEATEEPTEEATQPPVTGRIIVYRQDDAGNPVGGSCFEVVDTNQNVVGDACDEDGIAADDGTTGIENVPVGDYTMVESRVPEGYERAPDTQVTVTEGDVIYTVAAPATGVPTEEPTDEATEEPTEEATETPEGAVLLVTYDVDESAPLACIELDTTGAIGMMELPYACDNGVNDANPDAGTIEMQSLDSGEFVVAPFEGPASVVQADPQSVSLVEGQTASISFESDEPVTTSFTVQTTDGENPVGGACYILDESQELCDEGSGTVTFSNVTPGDHTVRMTAAPEGYNLADPDTQSVAVASDGSTSVSFTLARSITSFTVQTTDGENPVGGACYILDESQELCDEGSGTVTFSDVAPGDHTVRMTSAPGGYNIADPDTQNVAVAGDGSTSISFTVTLVTVDIVVTTVDGDTGEALGGACYTLDGGEISCDEQNSGQVVFQGETVGEKTLSMETAPEGFEPSADQVIPADVNSIEVGLFQETGTVVVNITDGTDPVGGACVLLDSGDPNNPICDTDDLGSITIPDVGVGERTVTIVSAPSGWDLPAEDARTQPVVVDGETDGQVTFTLTETPPATGNIAVTVQYSDTEPVLDACVTLTHGVSGDSFSACDTDDGGSQDGIVDLADLPEGQYVVHLQEGFQPDRDVEPGAQGSATVTAGADNTAELMLTLLPTTGTLQISVAAYDAPVSGACFTVAGTTVCDGQDGDTDGTPGVVVITGLEPAGDLLVTMSTVPDGYQAPANQTVEIEAGETTIIEFNLEAEIDPGSVTVRTIDGNGDPLTNACYRLVQGSTSYGPVCDSDPADGEVTFAAVPAGTYRLDQTRKPGTQFQTAPSQDVVVAAGENPTVEIRMDLRPGQLRITTLDRDDQSIVLQGACYVLVGDAEFGPFCDSDDGNLDGIVRFTNIPAGTYTLRQTVATAGYEPAANREVVIEAGGSRQITVLNSRVQPPVESGTLVVIPLAPNGEAVPGGCYQVFNGDTPVTHRVCDNADDQPARITFQNLPVGELTLRETLAPSPDWQLAADISVTIRNGETTTVEVPHEYKRGHVVIQAVNSVGLPLQGACFTLTNAGDTELCTDATGQATVSGLAPGTRELRQTRAPFGFRLNETPREVIVRPGQTTTVRVVFESQPPPNTGTVQIQKFFCPAGEAGERTVFLGGAQGNQELKQTVGCSPGVASFTLVAEDGSTESNAEFKTNAEGRAQLTAVNGIYLLTETDPDLPGNSAARLRVGTGQMTTVIVINYVAPPAPAPVTINVEGYTCPPGFNGSSFVDFQNSCMAESQLTNQISVRAESGNRYKRVTGDTGVRGKTSFVDLQAGTYSIWAERPNTVPVSYLFCGADVNNPTLKAVNGPVSVSLESGSTILCRVFQLTPLFDAEHGAIQVHKFNCPINERQRGYDYQNECGRPTEPVSFEIVQVDAKTRGAIGQPVRVSTNGDGIVQFPMLVPGTYKLTEVKGEWCFAQSNSVDAQGDVVVQKDKLSEVWVYNCVGTKSPPNTGSGDAAGVFGADGDIGPMQVLPNLLWPTVVLAGWLILRERKQA